MAKNLEGKIRTDTICVEIVNQLRGQVSERFIRECLDEKYKEKVRVENARKQRPKKDKETDKLAAVTPLNQQEVVAVDANGRTSIQEDEEKDKEPSTTTDSSITDKNFTPESYQQEQQSKNQSKPRFRRDE